MYGIEATCPSRQRTCIVIVIFRWRSIAGEEKIVSWYAKACLGWSLEMCSAEHARMALTAQRKLVTLCGNCSAGETRGRYSTRTDIREREEAGQSSRKIRFVDPEEASSSASGIVVVINDRC